MDGISDGQSTRRPTAILSLHGDKPHTLYHTHPQWRVGHHTIPPSSENFKNYVLVPTVIKNSMNRQLLKKKLPSNKFYFPVIVLTLMENKIQIEIGA